MLASLLFPYDDDAPSLIDSWLGELEREGCIVRYLHDGQTYLEVCNWRLHQKIDKPSASKIPPFDESSRIFANLRESSSEDQGSRIKDQGEDQGEEASAVADSPPEGKAKKQAPEEAKVLASLLFSLHRDQIDPGFRATPAQLEAWACDIEKLNRIDGRDWPDIEAAIRWIQAPGCFWAPNILSGKKLRDKFATVWGQMKRPAGPPPRVASQGSMLEMGD
jgi:hypothetical protein